MGSIPVTTTISIFLNALRYKWGALRYRWAALRDTNGRGTESISLSSGLRGTEYMILQIGGALQYFSGGF